MGDDGNPNGGCREANGEGWEPQNWGHGAPQMGKPQWEGLGTQWGRMGTPMGDDGNLEMGTLGTPMGNNGNPKMGDTGNPKRGTVGTPKGGQWEPQ